MATFDVIVNEELEIMALADEITADIVLASEEEILAAAVAHGDAPVSTQLARYSTALAHADLDLAEDRIRAVAATHPMMSILQAS